MSKIALVYSSHSNNTAKIGDYIVKKLGKEAVKLNVEEITEEEFLKYDSYILGSATWFEGELPNHWDEFLPAIEEEDLSGKKFAFFGLGDQKKYPDFFGDAIGKLSDFVNERGGKSVGAYPIKDYFYEKSGAERDSILVGVLIDLENQQDMMESRIDEWLNLVKKEF